MKEIYTKLMALACMFLLAGANAWADSWVSYVKSGSVSITITTSYADKFVTNLQAKANTQITYTFNHDNPSLVGVSVTGSNKLYLKPTTDGFINLRLACASGNPLTVTIHDNTDNTDVASVDVVTPTVTTNYYGETVLFEVVADHEYVLNASDNKTYYVTVVSKYERSETVELNEEMTASEMSSTIGNNNNITVVIMHRPITAGIWNTFCSPIRLGPNAIKAELKCETVYEMTSYNATDKTITFTSTDVVLANKPYLFKPTEDNSVLIVSNRTFPASYDPQSVKSGNLYFKAALAATNIYTTGNANSTKFFLNKSGKLVYPTSNEGNKGTIKGFRAYFESTVPISNLVREEDLTFIFVDDDDPDSIIRVEKDIFNETGRIYSVDGRYVGNSKENLSRGIYIQNGRKFIVK